MGLNSFQWMDTAGGGGKDVESAAQAVECIVQLSFYFDSDKSLVEEYLQPQLGVATLLNDILYHPPVELDLETKTNIVLLAQRLAKASSSLSSSSTTAAAKDLKYLPSQKHSPDASKSNEIADEDRHVMISYAWGAKKDLVIAFSSELKALGFEVWRDEEGSAFVPSMSGDVQDRMVCYISERGNRH